MQTKKCTSRSPSKERLAHQWAPHAWPPGQETSTSPTTALLWVSYDKPRWNETIMKVLFSSTSHSANLAGFLSGLHCSLASSLAQSHLFPFLLPRMIPNIHLSNRQTQTLTYILWPNLPQSLPFWFDKTLLDMGTSYNFTLRVTLFLTHIRQI